ncbi:hypothetical protein WCD84_06230 [Luteimonas sp. MJ145]
MTFFAACAGDGSSVPMPASSIANASGPRSRLRLLARPGHDPAPELVAAGLPDIHRGASGLLRSATAGIRPARVGYPVRLLPPAACPCR